MTRIFCDRCGVEVLTTTPPTIDGIRSATARARSYHQVCENCFAEWLEWMRLPKATQEARERQRQRDAVEANLRTIHTEPR